MPVSTSNDTYNQEFATYYDKITSHKDYDAEVQTLAQYIERTCDAEHRTLLDVGCGTGHHARLLAARGFPVTAIDLSPDMIRVAQSHDSGARFHCCGVADLTETGFDFGYSLFNVINCLGSLEALADFFGAIHRRLAPGATFLVECWNAIAVIAEPPRVVERTYEVGLERIVRTVTPSLDLLNQRLSLTYDIEVFEAWHADSDAKKFSVVHELVLFTPLEITYALTSAGFRNPTMRTALPSLGPVTERDRMLAFTAEA